MTYAAIVRSQFERRVPCAQAAVGNLFVVRTPLQLLNALEAQRAFGADHCILVVVSSEMQAKNVSEMVDARDWHAVHHFRVRTAVGGWRSRFEAIASEARVRAGLDRLARRWTNVDRLFLGNLNDLFCRHLANTLQPSSVILLDDGTATIGIAQRRAQGVQRGRPKSAKSAIYERVTGARTREPCELVFFTSYDVEVGPADGVVRNTFERLRSRVRRLSFVDETVFLGQPLVDTGEMRADLYDAYVAAAKVHFGRERFVYVPHWQEAPERVQRLATVLGVEVRRPRVPIEVELIQSGRLPRVLASFHCSALDNCRLMFAGSGMRITALTIAPEHLERNHEFIEHVYAYLRDRGGTELTVDSLAGVLLPGHDASTVLASA